MVKSYSKNANHNMRRPVVNKNIVDYMRTHLQENKGHLAELEVFARKENIPIIQHEVVAYFRFLLQTLQPKKILEVGTAIGFSALLMSKYIVFLPEILKRLKIGGVIVFDDVFQGGDIAKDIMEVRRGQRTIYRGLHRLFDATLDNPGLTASLVPMSDGLLMIRKNSENIILSD